MSKQHIKQNGIVYTPEWIVNLILDQVGYQENIYDKKIIDPACGDGAFLTIIADRLINDAKQQGIKTNEIKNYLEKNLFGFDIDEEAIYNCKLKLDKIAAKFGLQAIKWQITETDSLNKQNISDYLGFFDFIVGNPPYVRIQHLGETRRASLQKNWQLCKSGSTDIFIAFFELGYALLSENGKLGYITPNTYLKTKTAQALRHFIKAKRILKSLTDFGHHQLFENATTYSLITILDKAHTKNYFTLYKGNSHSVKFIGDIDTDNLKDDNWVLANNEALKKIKFIENRGSPLKQIADIHVGLTTLADDYYIFKDPIFDTDSATIRLKDGRNFTIEKNILKPIIKASVLKKSNEAQNRYIIFPYEKIAGKHSIIKEHDLKRYFPMTYRYFLAVKSHLDKRDKGKTCGPTWYAFGRSQGLDTSFGRKILTSSINLKPNFIPWELENYTFYAGYCIKFNGDLEILSKHLNSRDMEFYISHVGRDYQNNYKSFAKSFIENFGISMSDISIRDASLPDSYEQLALGV